MCGIAGIFHFGNGSAVNRDALEKMNDRLSHRGPDAQGSAVFGHVGLAMSRLAIIDVDSGQQPMCNEDESLWIVFNGEIYNFQALRDELINKGHPFKTKSDTEVILHLYEKMGDACVTRLRGMFAFAIWNKKTDRLFIARDRFGKKPLVYTVSDKRLAWSSEINSLITLPDVSREIDPQAIDLYLGLQYIPSPRTIYQSIRKLPPAHYLICEKGTVRVERYWNLPLESVGSAIDLEEAKHTIRTKFDEATKLRMISEVPLGAFLSGGVDSTAVVATMAKFSERPIKTFSIGFEEQDFSEVRFAREAAHLLGTDHTEFIVKPDMTHVLPQLAHQYGEPFGDSSALPTYYVSRETRKHVTVALTGDGGDEMFAGYSRYSIMKKAELLDMIPRPLRQNLATLGESLPTSQSQRSLLRRTRRFLTDVLAASTVDRYLQLVGIFSARDKTQLYNEPFRRRIHIEQARDYLDSFFQSASQADLVQQLLYVDCGSYLPECLMTKVDIASMANSLEARAPLLDHELMEYVFKLPSSWKLHGLSDGKWIFKEILSSTIPSSILNRPKMGFGIPLSTWLRNELKPLWIEAVFRSDSLSRRFFQMDFVQKLWDEHTSGRRDHSYRLWNLLMLELWHQSSQR